MSKHIFLMLLPVWLICFFPPSQVAAQSQEPGQYRNLSSEELRVLQIKQFKNWRKEIPDYEKRLYDRVKKINSRTVSLQRTVIISAVVLLILIPGLVFLIIRNSFLSSLLSTTDGTAVPLDDAEKKVGKQNKALIKKVLRNLASIRKRQVSLMKSLEGIRGYLGSTNEKTEHLNDLLARAEKQMVELEKDSALISEIDPESLT